MHISLLLFIVIIILFAIILGRLSDVKNWLRSLNENIRELESEVEKLRKEAAVKQLDTTAPTPQPAKPQEYKAPAPQQEQPRPQQPVAPVPPPVTQPAKPVPPPVEEKPVQYIPMLVEARKPAIVIEDTTPITTPRSTFQHVPKTEKESWFDKWLRDNPDIEKFIGENLINKIGIGILVLGIAFFVKYAIDQDWIKDIGRICIGLFCGGLLVGIAHRLRKNYHSFSSVLVGGGLAIFYFTIALAFHEYHRIGQTPAFLIMVVITIFAVLLSILYNRIELAIIAAVGGFITPFLVSTGDGNYIVLFTYLSVLNAGLIVLAYYKRWRTLNFIAFVFTQAIYLGWVFGKEGSANFSYSGTFIFGAVFYIMFVVMNVIHHVSRGSKLKAFDFIVLLSVNLCFYGAGIYLLHEGGMAEYKGLFTAALGVINLALGWLFFRQSKADKNFIYLIIAITVTYISLAAPVQLSGHYITLFWAVEAVALLWLYQRSFIKLLKVASLLVSALMLVSLVMDWVQVYTPVWNTMGRTPMLLLVIINKGFITGLVCSAAMLLIYNLLKREADTFYLPGITNRFIRNFYLVTGVLLLFITGLLETGWQFDTRLVNTDIEIIYIQLYIAAFALVMLWLLDWLKFAVSSTLRLVIPLLVFAVYAMNTLIVYDVERDMLTSGLNKGHFIAEWVSAVCILVLAFNTIRYVRANMPKLEKMASSFTWLVTIALIILFSSEVHRAFVWLRYTNAASLDYTENLYSKAGLSIVWGLSSFVAIWLGLREKYKPLRIIGLVVFGITLVKLFAYDIKNIPPAGKIIAFILLGVVLLVVSFMYQRLKKLIIDDKSTPQ